MKNKLYLLPIALFVSLIIGVVIIIASYPANIKQPAPSQVSITAPHNDFPLGFFSGQPKTQWLDDGREMKLLEDFTYTDKRGKEWTAESGIILDGATLPRSLWTIVGGPYEGKYRNASIIHDSYYVNYRENSDVVHNMFYEAMICSGVRETKASCFYWAVYNFSDSWIIVDGKPKFLTKSKPPTEEDVIRVQKFIEANNPPLEEIKELK